MLLRSLALASLLLAPTVSAQRVTVPFRGGTIVGDMVLPITWEGRPAFLVVNGNGPWSIATIAPLPATSPSWARKGLVARLTPRVVAVHFQDLRPCAPGSLAWISVDDAGGHPWLGVISAAGTMTWIAPSFAKGLLLDAVTHMNPSTWFAFYCGWQWCHGKCRPGYLDGPQFSAVVVAFELLEW
jgi:hypothetical protein